MLALWAEEDQTNATMRTQTQTLFRELGITLSITDGGSPLSLAAMARFDIIVLEGHHSQDALAATRFSRTLRSYQLETGAKPLSGKVAGVFVPSGPAAIRPPCPLLHELGHLGATVVGAATPGCFAQNLVYVARLLYRSAKSQPV